jgi:hypothetical protein
VDKRNAEELIRSLRDKDGNPLFSEDLEVLLTALCDINYQMTRLADYLEPLRTSAIDEAPDGGCPVCGVRLKRRPKHG